MTGMDKVETFKAMHHEPGSKPASLAGIISIDGNQRIAILSAEPEFAPLLELAASTLNKSKDFMIRARPPEDAKPMSHYKRSVARDDAEARAAVFELLEKQYSLILTPEA